MSRLTSISRSNKLSLGIDKYGNVRDGSDEIFLTTPRMSMPMGIEIYGDKKVVNLEFLEDTDDDADTRRFIRKVRKYEQDLEQQLDGKFLSSLKDASNYTAMRMRTRIQTSANGTVTSEFHRNRKEVGAYELKSGETGRMNIKLSHVWTMSNNGEDTAGAIWVIAGGELESQDVDNNSSNSDSPKDKHKSKHRKEKRDKNRNSSRSSHHH